MASRGPRHRTRQVSVGASLALALLLLVPGPARGATYPPLPVEYGRELVGNLSAPSLSPGDSGSLGFSVTNPFGGALGSVTLSLSVYAFNGFPGNATSGAPIAGSPVLSTAGASGSSVNVSLGSLGPGVTDRGSVEVATSSSTPSGAFAVRTALAFTLVSNSTSYLLESRGWFSDALWSSCTELPNGSVTLNLTCLGVSGVSPETAILVTSSEWDWVLGGVLVAAAVLAGAAAYVYFRRGPGSTSGAR